MEQAFGQGARPGTWGRSWEASGHRDKGLLEGLCPQPPRTETVCPLPGARGELYLLVLLGLFPIAT